MADRPKWLTRLLGEKRQLPRVPDGCCVYAVGDIHGRMDLLERLLERIWADAPTERNTLIFLGDYIDRGPASNAVLECLAELQRPGWDIVRLRGNHEQLLLEYLSNPDVYQLWRALGGAETLLSYGVRPPMFSNSKELLRAHEAFKANLPRAHLAFLTALPYAHTIGDYFFVHAGVRPNVRLQRQALQDLLWIRDDFLLWEERFEKFVVHGHTPTPEPELRANRANIDTGAFATGRLTVLAIDQDGRRIL